MNTFLVCVSRWMLATFWVFGALQQSESEILCDEPENPKIVLFEVNSSKVSLNWKNCRRDTDEIIISYTFKRERCGSGAEVIASRGATEGGFTMEDPFKGRAKYDARLDQELIIRNVQRNEEYVYILEIAYQRASGGFPEKTFRVTVEVKAARGSVGLSVGALWGIIGGCIAFVIIVTIIILVCCICKKKSQNSGAGGKPYSEAYGYRMMTSQKHH